MRRLYSWRFDQLDIIAALSTNRYLSGPYASQLAAAAPGAADDLVDAVPELSAVVLLGLGQAGRLLVSQR